MQNQTKNMTTTDKTTTTKCCFSSVLRRLLCTGSLPTHPSDQLVGDTKEKVEPPPEKSEAIGQAAVTPGVVAKLMGLETLPNISLSPKDRTLGDLFRSRSVNSVDFLSLLDPPAKHPQHRRVRTSVSFREIPSHGKHEYNIVLTYEKENETAHLKMRNHRVNSQQEKQKTVQLNSKSKEKILPKKLTDDCCKKSSSRISKQRYQYKDVPRKIDVGVKERRPFIKAVVDVKQRHKRSEYSKKANANYLAKNVRGHYNSKNSNSFLVLGDARVHPEANLPGTSHVMCSNKLSSQIMESYHPCKDGAGSLCCDSRELKKVTRKDQKSAEEKKIKASFSFTVLEEVCRVTKAGLDESPWVPKKVSEFEDYEEFCVHFGQQIFEALLSQVVNELVLIHSTRKSCT